MIDRTLTQFDDIYGLILHSDQKWQYQMESYKKWFKDYTIIFLLRQLLDQSLMENFFGIMKNEMFYSEKEIFKTLYELKVDMDD